MRDKLKPFLYQMVTAEATLSAGTHRLLDKPKLTLVYDVRINGVEVTDHLWVALPHHHIKPGKQIRFRGRVIRYRKKKIFRDYCISGIHKLRVIE